jgi:hypothetical protein
MAPARFSLYGRPNWFGPPVCSCGGEGGSQSPLKDRAFSTFLDQNPPFELPPEKGDFALDKSLSRPMDRHRQPYHPGD